MKFYRLLLIAGWALSQSSTRTKREGKTTGSGWRAKRQKDMAWKPILSHGSLSRGRVNVYIATIPVLFPSIEAIFCHSVLKFGTTSAKDNPNGSSALCYILSSRIVNSKYNIWARIWIKWLQAYKIWITKYQNSPPMKHNQGSKTFPSHLQLQNTWPLDWLTSYLALCSAMGPSSALLPLSQSLHIWGDFKVFFLAKVKTSVVCMQHFLFLISSHSKMP